jgi:hypothetical protein
MRPSLSKYLAGATGTLARDVSPLLESAYARAQVGSLSMVLNFVSREADRAADTLVREQDAIRALFADAAKAALPDDLCTRLREAAAGHRASLKVSELERENTGLKAVLIELHEAVEASSDPASAEIEARIWKILNDGADARIVGFGR